MKPLLYIGAALMVGAGIYGFVDFKKKNHSREFQSLYKGEPKKIQEPAMPTPAPVVVAEPVVTEKKDTVAARKQVAKKNEKVFSPKQFSRAALEKEIVLEEIVEDSVSAPEIKVEQQDH